MDAEQPAGKRSLLDLLSLPFVFSQQKLLSANEFVKAWERRDTRLFFGKERLESLHKAGALLPTCRVALNPRTIRQIAKEEKFPVWHVASEMLARQIISSPDEDVGMVIDPRSELFRPWRTYERQSDGVHFRTSYFFYSPYQLLLVPMLQDLTPLMKVRRVDDFDFKYTITLTERQKQEVVNNQLKNDWHVVLLSTLDRIYHPRITGRIILPGFADHARLRWDAFTEEFDPAACLAWLGEEATHVRDTAEHLINTAGFIDPLDDWLPLVRLCRPEQWQRLKGDALLAVDYRVAGEMLLRFYEDLVSKDAAPPLPIIPRYANHAFKERLKPEYDALDSVLMDFGLSPHPSLILFLEGETEMEIIPRVLNHLTMRWPRNFVEIHNAKTGQANLGRLASLMVPLAFGENHGRFVEIARPATRILGVFDKEGVHSRPDSSEEERQKWIQEFLNTLPIQYRTQEVRSTISYLFEIVTWGEDSFEFAHFSDEELYQSLVAYCKRLKIPERKVELWKITDARLRKKSIESCFPGKAGKNLSKPALAVDMWPLLAAKIDAAIAAGEPDRVPVVRVLGQALERAMSVHRSNVALPLHSSSATSSPENTQEQL